jgi:hypothetical protein
MCEKLAYQNPTVYVHMFNSCFHLEPASQDRDILEVNFDKDSSPVYLKSSKLKWENFDNM